MLTPRRWCRYVTKETFVALTEEASSNVYVVSLDRRCPDTVLGNLIKTYK